MAELTVDEETAALEGWVANPAVPVEERLNVARQVIERLHARERGRVRTAVVDTLRYVRVYWIGPNDRKAKDIASDMEDAETQTRTWEMEPGWCCPFCEEVACDGDCPLARMREELGDGNG